MKKNVKSNKVASSCKKKQSFKDSNSAQIVVRKLVKRERKKPHLARSGFLRPYLCPNCNRWHIGHSRSSYIGLLGLIELANSERTYWKPENEVLD